VLGLNVVASDFECLWFVLSQNLNSVDTKRRSKLLSHFTTIEIDAVHHVILESIEHLNLGMLGIGFAVSLCFQDEFSAINLIGFLFNFDLNPLASS